MNKVVKILGIVGSLRKKSYNNALMQVAFEVLPKGQHFRFSILKIYHSLIKTMNKNPLM